MESEKFAQQLTDEGFDEVLARDLPAGQFVDLHTHAFDVKALVTAGQVILGVGGQLTTYGVGQAFTLPRNTEHSEQYGDNGVSYVLGRKHH